MAKRSVSESKFPVGMIFVLIFIGLGILGQVRGLFNPMMQMGPKLLSGSVAVILGLVILFIQGILFYGILKRKKWARTLGIAWFLVMIVQGVINLFFFLVNRGMYDSYLTENVPEGTDMALASMFMSIFVVMGILIGVTIGIIIIIYSLRNKKHFVN